LDQQEITSLISWRITIRHGTSNTGSVERQTKRPLPPPNGTTCAYRRFMEAHARMLVALPLTGNDTTTQPGDRSRLGIIDKAVSWLRH
jgi:hypothetical protein